MGTAILSVVAMLCISSGCTRNLGFGARLRTLT
jgi:hypothetical protein